MHTSRRIHFPLNGELLLAFVLVTVTTVFIRLTEFPIWDAPSLTVAREYLMATHDAYNWLAGVKGVGNFVHDPFTRFLALVHTISGLSVADIGFWAPVFCVPLLAIPVCLLARALRLTEGGLAFGILVTSGLGFLVRTRLGFCDTDIVNLIFPVSMVCALVAWLEGERVSSDAVPQNPVPLKTMVLPVVAGLCGKFAIYIYPGSSSILLPAVGMSGLLALFMLRNQVFLWFAMGFVVAFGLAFGGWLALALVAAWLVFILYAAQRMQMTARTWLLTIVVLLIVLGVFSDVGELLRALIYRLALYMKGGTADMVNNATGLTLPDIARSVREAQALDWTLVGPRLGGNWIIFVLGLSGFGFVCWRRPALLVFLPFLGLGLASIKLGNRFTMYGTVAIGMGLGLGLSEFMVLLRQGVGRRWIVQLVLACVTLWPSAQFMQSIVPMPVLPKEYAQTLIDLRTRTEPNALLWQWWDYGYAAQYYAERATMGDGSRQSGPWLYPLALVHCATSPVQAGQLIRYFGQQTLASGLKNTDDVVRALFTGTPVAGLKEMDAGRAKAFLDSIGAAQRFPTADVPQYFVLSWENLRLAGWISYYGSWDVVSGSSAHGRIQQLRGAVQVDAKNGQLTANGQGMSLESVDVIEQDGSMRHLGWQNGSDMHVVINQLSRQVFIMESRVYESMMVQMLLFPPANFASDFELVEDNFPWTRVYRVR